MCQSFTKASSWKTARTDTGRSAVRAMLETLILKDLVTDKGGRRRRRRARSPEVIGASNGTRADVANLRRIQEETWGGGFVGPGEALVAALVGCNMRNKLTSWHTWDITRHT